MIRQMLLVLLSLFLTACVTGSVKDASPASDLDTFLANVKDNSQQRFLPNGKNYCGELAMTEEEQDDCIGDLEDKGFLDQQDKDNILYLTEQFVGRQKLLRNPCSRWELFWKKPRCMLSPD